MGIAARLQGHIRIWPVAKSAYRMYLDKSTVSMPRNGRFQVIDGATRSWSNLQASWGNMKTRFTCSWLTMAVMVE